MSTPEVSVVMSVYNGAEHLAETLDSVLAQEGCDFEFIVVNDGSTDETGAILESYAAADARLRVLHQDNTGLTRALARGCAEARGEFIARQDAGDQSMPSRIRKQLDAMCSDRSLAFVSSRSRYVGPEGEFLYEQSGTGEADRPINIVNVQKRHGVIDGPSHHGSVMFCRDKYVIAGGYREEFYFGQDWDLWYRLAMLGKFQLLQETLYQARIGVADISVGNKVAQEHLAALSLDSFKSRLAGEEDTEILASARGVRASNGSEYLRSHTSRGCYFIGECLRKNGETIRARKYFLRSIVNNPLHIKAWTRLLQVMVGAHKADNL